MNRSPAPPFGLKNVPQGEFDTITKLFGAALTAGLLVFGLLASSFSGATAQVLTLATTPQGSLAFNTAAAIAKIVLEKNTKMPRIKGPTHIVEHNMLLTTNKDVDGATIYKIAKVLAQSKMDLAKSFGIFFRQRPKTIGTATSIPHHPAALRAYRDLGLPTAK